MGTDSSPGVRTGSERVCIIRYHSGVVWRTESTVLHVRFGECDMVSIGCLAHLSRLKRLLLHAKTCNIVKSLAVHIYRTLEQYVTILLFYQFTTPVENDLELFNIYIYSSRK